MDRIRLGLVGCGGMGTRHLYGLRELRGRLSTMWSCVPCATFAATTPNSLLLGRKNSWASARGSSPLWKRCAARCLPSMPWTWRRTHLSTTRWCQALDVGLHVLVEKPCQRPHMFLLLPDTYLSRADYLRISTGSWESQLDSNSADRSQRQIPDGAAPGKGPKRNAHALIWRN